MNACSSETLAAARWYTGTRLAKAMSPTCSSDRPRTRNWSGSRVTRPPAAATARARMSCDGVRTMTAWPELRSMNSAIPQSAISRPRPTTIRWSAVFSISDIRWLETNTARPSAASDLISLRIHKMPSGSSPFTGSSNISTCGSPSSAAAMPSRWLMPSENPLDRFPATPDSPTMSSTSATRRGEMPLVYARHSRWFRALRPPWAARASISAPTSRIGLAAWRCGFPSIVTAPAVGRSRPRISRIVVVLPAPFGPTKPVTIPGRTVKLRSSTASVCPYLFVSPRASIIGHSPCSA
jgi:hypothetical protein